MRLIRRIAGLIALLLGVLGGACALPNASAGLPAVLVPEGAYDVHKQDIGDGDAVQLTYKVHMTYPKQAVGNATAAELLHAGWTECSKETNWESYLDESGEKPLLVHQAQRVFARDHELLAIAMLYHSQPTSPRLSSPRNDEQNVVIIKYQLARPAVREQLARVFPQCMDRR